MKKSLVRLCAMACFTLLSSQGWAAMIVERSILYYLPGEANRQDVEIRNPDQEPLYVEVEIMEILNPGTDKEEKKMLTNPKESGLLVTPNRLAVQPGAKQMIRVVNLKGAGDKEKVYRINLKPVAADIEAEQTAIKILVGYQLLVLVAPAKPEPKIESVREGKKLILTNKGNVNILLSRGTQCAKLLEPKPADAKEECDEMPIRRLYPGNSMEVELKYDTPVNYLFSNGPSNQSVSY